MIARFALFDMLNFVTPVRRVAPALLMVVAAPVISPWPAFGIGAAAVVMSLLASNPFATDERGRLDTLYGTLPLTRRSVVAGRYLALVVLYVVVALLASIAAIVVQLNQGQAVDFRLLGEANVISVLMYAIALAVQLPFFFSLGFTRARAMTFIPSALLVGCAALASQLGILNQVDLVDRISRNLTIVWIASPVIVAAALGASIAISFEHYRRRAL